MRCVNAYPSRFSDSGSMIHPTGRECGPRTITLGVTSRPFAGVIRGVNMSINKDQVEGRVKEAAGKVQEAAGKAVGSTTQQVKGAVNKNVGAAQAKFGDMKSHVKDSRDAKDAK
jgi:uncharacterized protein YjbJ (UPF0337 family)